MSAAWYRVFAATDQAADPRRLVEHLRQAGQPLASHRFRGDEQGWFTADLTFAATAESVQVDRFLAGEEGIRADLNAWAAWVETIQDNPNQAWLMQHLIATAQLFTFQATSDSAAAVSLCRLLAVETNGLYQIDGLGIFAADGSLLLTEA